MAKRDEELNKAAGLWLAIGAALLAVVLPLHGPIHADLSVQMTHIAEGHGRWVGVHWLAFLALIALAVAGLASFGAGVATGADNGPFWAWLLFAIGATITTGTAIAEATAVTAAARAGDFETFLMWWQFASGLGNGFMLFSLAVAAIAWSLSGTALVPVPVWSCKAAAVIAIVSALGWSLNQHLGVEIGGLIWFLSTLLMALWLLWLGIGKYKLG